MTFFQAEDKKIAEAILAKLPETETREHYLSGTLAEYIDKWGFVTIFFNPFSSLCDALAQRTGKNVAQYWHDIPIWRGEK